MSRTIRKYETQGFKRKDNAQSKYSDKHIKQQHAERKPKHKHQYLTQYGV